PRSGKRSGRGPAIAREMERAQPGGTPAAPGRDRSGNGSPDRPEKPAAGGACFGDLSVERQTGIRATRKLAVRDRTKWFNEDVLFRRRCRRGTRPRRFVRANQQE